MSTATVIVDANANANANALANANAGPSAQHSATTLPSHASQRVEPTHWSLQTRSGLSVFVPPTLRSLTTFVLLEQESWFEPEMSLLPHLLQGGVHALDIGANHGLYALQMALDSGTGHVWAFEPTLAPRTALQRSVQANGLGGRITVVAAGLSDSAGQAQFEVQDNSELNTRVGNNERAGWAPPRLETVQMQTLDGALAALGVTQPIGFVKLDAEGDEARVLAGATHFFARQSPLVMFEYKHGQQVNSALLQAFAELNYGIFRWSAELALLLPFDAASAETAFALNLVAVRPPQQAQWAARGLLVTATALNQVELPQVSQPGLSELEDRLLAHTLSAVVAAHEQPGLSAAERVLLVVQARDTLLAATQPTADGGAGPGLECWVLLLHCLQALGQPLAATRLGAQLMAHWPAELTLTGPFMTPLRAQLQLSCSTNSASWLRQRVGEFVAMGTAYSSYFEKPSPARWAALLQHPDHSAEVERRYLLSYARADQVVPAAMLPRLVRLAGEGQSNNRALWLGLLASMRVIHEAAATAATAAAAAAVGGSTADAISARNEAASGAPFTLNELWARLPVAAVTVVDVGASPLGRETEPYAPLVQMGRAQVIGFEPDAAALAALKQRHAHPVPGSTQHFLPHFVGNGEAAVFHETHWSLTASLFEPNRELLDRYQMLGELVQEKARHAVQTVRLDDVIAAGGMDLLKIDVQGAERLVFEGAPQRLDECLMVWTEVEFVPLYREQALFAEVDQQLRRHGLHFLCFVGLAHRALASWPRQGAPAPQRPQQLWADAIYVPSPQRIHSLNADQAARLALLAHHVAAAHDLCHAALLRLDALQGSGWAARYLTALGAGR